MEIYGFILVTIPKVKLCSVNTGLGVNHLFVHSAPESCTILHDLMDCSPPGSSVHVILQARILERVAISFFSTAGHLSPLHTVLVRVLQRNRANRRQ